MGEVLLYSHFHYYWIKLAVKLYVQLLTSISHLVVASKPEDISFQLPCKL